MKHYTLKEATADLIKWARECKVEVEHEGLLFVVERIDTTTFYLTQSGKPGCAMLPNMKSVKDRIRASAASTVGIRRTCPCCKRAIENGHAEGCNAATN